MTVEDMIKFGDIVEFRKHLAAATDKEIMSLWCKNYGRQDTFRKAAHAEAEKRGIMKRLW